MSATETVIVVDLQTGMFDGVVEPPLDDAAGLLDRVQDVLGWARRSGRKVAFVRHDGPPGDPLAPGEPGWPVLPALGQAADEPTFPKKVADAFSNPDLARWLDGQGARALILLGAQTDMCIAATVAGALRHGFDVTVVADGHGTWPSGGETAAEIVARHNEQFAAAGADVIDAATLTAGRGPDIAEP